MYHNNERIVSSPRQIHNVFASCTEKTDPSRISSHSGPSNPKRELYSDSWDLPPAEIVTRAIGTKLRKSLTPPLTSAESPAVSSPAADDRGAECGIHRG